MSIEEAVFDCMMCKGHFVISEGKVYPLVDKAYPPTTGSYCSAECYQKQLDISGLPEMDVQELMKKFREVRHED